MLSREENTLITQTAPDTPCGSLMRAYWQPAALVEELPDERPAIPVRLLGEDLVLFRNEDGSYGLVGRYCAHRGADLAFGRLEGGGVRCLYHGWLYGRRRALPRAAGRAGAQPLQREDPAHELPVPRAQRHRLRLPRRRRAAAVPDYDCFAAPDAYTFAFKGLWDCNWLQGVEGGIDPSHVSFLHRFLDEDPRAEYGQQFREPVDGTDTTLSKLVGDYFRPHIEVEQADHGLRVYAIRDLDEERRHVRITNLMFPNAFVVPFGNTKVFTQWHVPIDDESHYWYMILYSFDEPVDKETMRAQRLGACTLPDYRPVRNRGNNWGFDATEQQSLTYTGMGLDINVHDQWAVESAGAIQDRTVEHLGVSDRAITANRRLLIGAIAEHRAGNATPGLPASEERAHELQGPQSIDLIVATDDWQEAWRHAEAQRRASSPWAATTEARELQTS